MNVYSGFRSALCDAIKMVRCVVNRVDETHKGRTAVSFCDFVLDCWVEFGMLGYFSSQRDG